MADVTTYKRCIMAHAFGGTVYPAGTVLPAAHPAVTQSPAYWVALSDSEMSDGKHGVH